LNPAMKEESRGTRSWLREAGIRPRKAWGQNFLLNPRVAEAIVQRFEPGPGIGILEVGAGAGSLTLPALHAGAAVIAVERDPALGELLSRRIAAEAPAARAEVRIEDILAIDPAVAIASFAGVLRERDLPLPEAWLLAGNLPYRFTTQILAWAAKHRLAFGRIFFMVQREYAERLMAAPGTGEYGSLTVWMSLYFQPRKEMPVGPGNFWPIPKVDSVVVRLDPLSEPPVDIPSEEIFTRICRAAFGRRRKMLAGALAGGLHLSKAQVEAALAIAGVDGRLRAEDCDPAQFAAMSRAFAPMLNTCDPESPSC